MEHQQRSVTEAANKVVRERINSNRAKIKSTVKTVVLCGQQNLVLRGHRDDAKHYDDPLNNPRNFQVLLNFRIDSGDKGLENHFKMCPKNAMYRSKTIQNELLGCCGEQILEHIINEVKEAKFFSVLADEVSDVSSKEQMSMVLRYVDKAGHIHEAFVGFLECDQGTSGQAVCDGIKKTLRNFGLDLNNCRGQGYDGAGNMAGRYIGAAKLFQNDYPQASYVHCKAHRLNLCMCEACKVPAVRNMMGTVQAAHDFFYFPKRQCLLEETIKDVCPEEGRTKLLNTCKTRWIERIDCLKVFRRLHQAIFFCLEKIKPI